MKKNRILVILLFFISVHPCVFVFAGKNGDENLESYEAQKGNRSYISNSKASIDQEVLIKKQNNNLFNIPDEILYNYSSWLCPIDMINLFMVSKHLSEKKTDLFWEHYIRIHKYQKWDESTTAIKVAFAHSLFIKGKIPTAALLGHPKALELLNVDKHTPNQKKKHKVKKFFEKEFFTSIDSSSIGTYFSQMFFLPPPDVERINYYKTKNR